MSRKKEWRSKKHPSGRTAKFPVGGRGDKSGLPVSDFPLMTERQAAVDRPNLQADRRYRKDKVAQRPVPQMEDHWYNYLAREFREKLTGDTPDSSDIPVEERVAIKHLKKLQSSNPVSRIEGTLYMRRYHPEVIKEYYRVLEKDKEEKDPTYVPA